VSTSPPPQTKGPRVLYIMKHLVPYGVERQILELCRALDGRATLGMLALGGGPFEREFAALNVPIHICPARLQTPLRQRLPVGRGLFASALAAAREFGPDIIHAQHTPRVWELAAMVCQSLDVPLVVHLHGPYGRAARLPGGPRPWYRSLARPLGMAVSRWIEGRALRALRSVYQEERLRVIAASHGVGKTFTDETGMPHRTVYPAVDVPALREHAAKRVGIRDELCLPPDARLVAMAARIQPQKDPVASIRCAQRVCAQRPDTHFVWAGGGDQGEVTRATEAAGLRGRFHWLGHRDDAMAIVREADVFLLLSRWEGLPTVLIEALLLGVPAVATDVIGSNEAVRDGVDGFCVPSGDAAAAANCVLRLLGDPELSHGMGEAGRAGAEERFSMARLAEGTLAVYHELLAGSRYAADA